MQIGRASRTALRVAIRRAAHQAIDRPRVLEDPIAERIIGPGYERDMERAMHYVARDFRLYMSVRSRYAEDRLAQQVAEGVRQYVILGAGLDTFAYRNPFPSLRVFEVDFPATQAWKHELLAQAGIAIPENVTFIPLDLEHKSLAESLLEAGLDAAAPAFFGWLGVVPYLTLEAFRSTLATIGRLPKGTAVSFDYAFPPETLSAKRRKVFDTLAERVAAAGEPLQLFFTPETLEKEAHAAGFSRVEQFDSDRMNEAYFKDRVDGLKLSPVRVGMLATAWV
jgi:methyltransferase (TIGR00027 family)